MPINQNVIATRTKFTEINYICSKCNSGAYKNKAAKKKTRVHTRANGAKTRIYTGEV